MTKVSTSQWCVKDALNWGKAQLESTPESSLTTQMLLAHALDCTTAHLIGHPERLLSPSSAQVYRQLVARRAHHEPVAYLIGHREFYGLDLAVDQRVLIPRPETELLVEQALDTSSRWARPLIADVGTGSGAIAVAIATRLLQARIFAIDCSAPALQVAQENARRHGVASRITFLQGDLLGPLTAKVNLVVTNLPYVSETEYAALPPHIREWEPRSALVAGSNGLATIETMLRTAHPHLTDDGVILLEIGAAQGRQVVRLAQDAFPSSAQITLLTDYAQYDRAICVDLLQS